MPLTFPQSPTLYQQATTGGRTYQWNGEAWEIVGNGVAGPTGPSGPTGPIGQGVSLNGSVANIGALPTGASSGDAYVVTANGNLYVWSGSSWNSVGQIVGPTGAASNVTGPTGAASNVTGPTGASSAGGGFVQVAATSSLPATGATGGVLYVVTDVSRVYRWDSSNGVYVELGPK
jgi:hypothetical protein